MKLTSPNYPDPYDPLEYCTWNITAPSGHFVTLDFERIHVSTLDIVFSVFTVKFGARLQLPQIMYLT